MTNPTRIDAQDDAPQGAICPHCGDEPMTLSTQDFLAPSGILCCIFYCGNPKCRKVFNIQAVGAVQKREQPKIIRPA